MHLIFEHPVKTWKWSTHYISSLFQDEKYNHIDETEINKVEKCVRDTMEWLSNVISTQAKQSLDQDPVVRAGEIKGKLRVSADTKTSLITEGQTEVLGTKCMS